MLADCVVPERAYERIGEEAYAQALGYEELRQGDLLSERRGIR